MINMSPDTRLEALISHLLHMRDRFDDTGEKARSYTHIEVQIKSNQFISETADSKIEIQDNDNVQPLTEVGYGKAVASGNIRRNK